MRNLTPIKGIHHITAVTSSAAENLKFYESVLGLRLVKQTVNFDDPHTYHLYYGDASGSPGTILTFFPWEKLPQGRPGAGMVTAINFAIPKAAVAFWKDRLAAYGVAIQNEQRFGMAVIRFSDPYGLPLELTGVEASPPTTHWEQGPIAADQAIGGFHSATTTLTALDASQQLLVDQLGMRLVGRDGNRYRFAMDSEAIGHFYDLLVDPATPKGRPGSGTVHHIAFRTPDDRSQAVWQSTLRAAGYAATEVRDRKYFRSIYFSAPQGVLFEIATDPPGFAVDEPVESLGRHLQLPEQYEPQRKQIEQRLPVLRPSKGAHLFQDAGEPDDGRTIVTLHGTGGNESDLLPIVRDVGFPSAVLGLRGEVTENGMRRFFKRLANNVFDEPDLIHRAHVMAESIQTAVAENRRDSGALTALGYSNGANMAAALLLLHPELFSRAVLLRPMAPFKDPVLPNLAGKDVLILRGERDAVIPSNSTDDLARQLADAGANLTVQPMAAGHEITPLDVAAIAEWHSQLKTAAAPSAETSAQSISA